MFKLNKSQAPQRDRNGLKSYILLQKENLPDSKLAVTWVEILPGAAQKPHHHEPEQVYVFVRGSGRMSVGDEKQDVQAGDFIHIPSNVVHFVENTGQEMLVYISAATPAFSLAELYDRGELSNVS